MVKPIITKPSQNFESIFNQKTNEDFNKLKPDPNSPELKEGTKVSSKNDMPKANKSSLAKEKSNVISRNKLIM